MPRIARVVAVGLPHHVTQRGNYRQEVFVNDYDREKYLVWFNECSSKYGLSVLAYCLMSNHVHFVAVPDNEDAMAKTLNTAHMHYSQYFNDKLEQKGHLWQGRYYSCVLDEPHFLLAARYVERNPVRAGLVEKPWQWPWSSAGAHVTGKNTGLIELGDISRFTGMTPDAWKKYIDSPEPEGYLKDIRKNTSTGRPLGLDTFVQDLEGKLGRKLK